MSNDPNPGSGQTSDPVEPWAPAPTSPVATAPTPSAPAVAVRPRKSGGVVLNLLLVVAGALAIGGVAFAVGRSSAPAAAAAFPGGGGQGGPGGSFAPGAGGGRGGLGQGGAVSIDGTITSIDATSVTLTLASGQTVTFKLDTTTTYHEATAAASGDVAVGDTVAVKVIGGGRVPGGATPSTGTTPTLTAGDITVSR